ncbi:hypothetical protein C0Q70_10723 [Pomacea canaliculata]|uniref:Chitin-binding type-4 domain-containing protein n=1 Tax=Pomacea canaliculata TaxID=400727 RepID=A0A2T7P401_POMCA|nr:uncharacterized protein LOC112567350 [Pomacea canaliculata]PVD28138.1 hypothetical protein C0Q70_10723 [Pomacea canaliculata]
MTDRTTMMTMTLVLSLFAVPVVDGHGRLIDPPARGSAWRFGFNTPINYNDNEMSCGGLNHQWYILQGKCGVCGDRWDANPRPHEVGGTYATGTIVRTYTQGQTIQVTVQITSNHLGWFEFRICPVSDPTVEVTLECLDTHLLPLASNGQTRYKIDRDSRNYVVDLVLPSDLVCDHCVFQWKYHTGNSWGRDPDGVECVGCGAVQEEFYGCADIAVLANDSSPPPSAAASTDAPQIKLVTTAAPSTSMAGVVTEGQGQQCRAVGVWRSVAGMNSWCATNCGAGYCPSSHCRCG